MRRAVVGLVVATVSLLLASGCTEIPSSGDINHVESGTQRSGSSEQFHPVPPSAGDEPHEIVRGFLDAMLAYPASTKIASQFLTRQAARDWDPGSGTTVYTMPHIEAGASDTSTAQVTLEVARRARLDAQGRWSNAASREEIALNVTREDGQWRIANPPEGLWVTQGYGDDYVRPFNLYFLDRGRGILVPEPVYQIVGDQLSTRLVTALAAGPLNSTAATTAVPITHQVRASVPIDAAGVADVAFSASPAQRSAETDRDMSAQIVWTLRQVLGIKAVRIRMADEVLAPSGRVTQPTTSFPQFDPERSTRRVGAVARGATVTLTGKETSAIAPGSGVAAVAVGDRVASLAGNVVTVQSRAGRDLAQVAGAGLLVPDIDTDETVWVVESGGRIRIVPRGQQEARRVGSLPGVSSFAVSPDGARYAAVVNSVLVTGSIKREAQDVVGLSEPVRLNATVGVGGGPIATSMVSSDVDWLDSTHVVHLSTPVALHPATGRPSAPQAFSSQIDGSVTAPLQRGPALPGTAVGTLRGIAVGGSAAPQIYVLDENGRVWLLDGESWAPTSGLEVSSIG